MTNDNIWIPTVRTLMKMNQFATVLKANAAAFYFHYKEVALKETGSFISIRHLLMQHHHQTSKTQVYHQHYTFKSFHLIKVTWKLSGCLWIMYTGALSHHQDFIVVSRGACLHCACSPSTQDQHCRMWAEAFYSSGPLFPRHDLLSTSVVGTVLSPRHRTLNEMDKSPALGKLTILKPHQEVLWHKTRSLTGSPKSR